MKDIVPKLRIDLEIIPTDYQGQNAFVVKDTLGLINKPVLLYGDILEFVTLIDGRRNVRDIQLELIRHREGMLVSSEEVNQILVELDYLFLLDSDQYRQERDRIISDFADLEVRSAALAGRAYPDSLGALQAYLESLFQQGSNTINRPEGKRIVALVAPHIDLSVGKDVYAKTYGFIRELSPKNIILFGTGHSILDHLISITEKDYDPFLEKEVALSELLIKIRDEFHQALFSFDSLTRVLNRQAFLRILAQEYARAFRTGKPCCIAMVDLDHFKNINDNYGQQVRHCNILRLVPHQILPWMEDLLGGLG